MKLKLNKKGFTLVEILVVLMIVTIVMALAGSVVLSSFSLFGTATQDDVTKRSLDSLVEYVKSEITYAGDVRIASTKPEGEGWMYLDVNKGRLVENKNLDAQGTGKEVYSDTFYYGNTLDISISNFVDNKQFDIQFTFEKKNYDDYIVNVTIQFPNIELKMESDSTFKPFGGLNESSYIVLDDSNGSDDTGLKLYYKSGIEKTEPETDVPNVIKGTVADQIAFLNNTNNREFWDEDVRYRRGDMMYYNGYWWYCLEEAPLGGNPDVQYLYWKKIDAYYDQKSGYETGDIIIYDGKYFEAQKDIINEFNPLPGTDIKSWRQISDTLVADNTYKNNYILSNDNTRYEIDYPKWPILDFEYGKKYTNHEIVKIYPDGFEGNDDLAVYFKCVKSNLGDISPFLDTNYAWKRLSIQYYPNSAYEKGDLVYLSNENGFYARAHKTVYSENDLVIDIIFDLNHEKVYWDRDNPKNK